MSKFYDDQLPTADDVAAKYALLGMIARQFGVSEIQARRIFSRWACTQGVNVDKAVICGLVKMLETMRDIDRNDPDPLGHHPDEKEIA